MKLRDGVDFPQFGLVSRAYRVASTLRGNRRPLRVAVVDAEGILLAVGVLHGYTQVSMFSELLRRCGFNEMLPRTAQRFAECDAAFVQATDELGGTRPVLPQVILSADSLDLSPAARPWDSDNAPS